MSRPEFAALIEVLSFMFVTIDLYGKNRLEKTNNNLVERLDRIQKSLDSLTGITWRKAAIHPVMVFIYSLALVIVIAQFYGIVANGRHLDILTIGIIALTSILTGLISVMLLLALFLFCMWFLKTVSNFFVFILGVVNFEGLLLVIGALMFFFSKYLDL